MSSMMSRLRRRNRRQQPCGTTPSGNASRWDMRTVMVVASASGALPMLVVAVVSPAFLRPDAIPVLSMVTAFTAVTVAVAVRRGRLSDGEFAVLGAGGMIGVAISAYLIADPAGMRAVTAMLAIVPAIAASGSSKRVTGILTAGAVSLATLLSWIVRESSGVGVALIACGAAVTTVVVPVILIAGLRNALTKVNRQMAATNRQLVDANRRLESLAGTDPLTGLLNRRGMLAAATNLLGATHGVWKPIAAYVVDVDHFKDVNDSFGHSAGDAALVVVARALGRAVADVGAADTILARTGGDEFLILTPLFDVAAGRPGIGDVEQVEPERATWARDGVEAQRDLGDVILSCVRELASVTVSVGKIEIRCTEAHHARTSEEHDGMLTDSSSASVSIDYVLDELMRAADAALYAAKAAGRDRVCYGETLLV